MHQQHILFPNCSFCYFPTVFPMNGISSDHLIYLEGDTGATCCGLESLLNKDFCKSKDSKLVFLCPILELKLIYLDSVDGVLVDFETKQVETRNFVPIFLLSWIWFDAKLVYLLLWCMQGIWRFKYFKYLEIYVVSLDLQQSPCVFLEQTARCSQYLFKKISSF
jgi:hypothetical protein